MIKLVPPCRAACPAGINVQRYISLVSEGNDAEALAVIREDNPFPSVCGRVCMHPCEAECERGKIDEPVAINAIKLFAAQKGRESLTPETKPVPKLFREKVAVIGSGPAGLSAAYFLVLKGYLVTVFEAMPEPGGKLRACIPAYRLPKEDLDFDIRHLVDLGVEIRTNVAIGKDISIEALESEGYRAIFIAAGAHRNRHLGLDGEDLDGVTYALDFLRDVNLGKPVDLGKDVAVIGAGNAAVEAARVALRLGCRVDMYSILPRREIPANPEEFKQMEMEGALVDFCVTPQRLIGKNGRLKQMELVQTRLGAPDNLGRKSPIAVQGTESTVSVDTAIIAIGEEPETLVLPDGITVSKWGMIGVNPDTMQTGVTHIYAGGDVVTGTTSVVESIGAGKRAAASIHAQLQSEPLAPVDMIRHAPDLPKAIGNASPRETMPLLPLAARANNFAPVELGLSETATRNEATRCLRCGSFENLLHQEVISKGLCTACGACIGACPGQSIEMAGTIPELKGECGGCGSCFQACPGKYIRLDVLDRKISGRDRKDNEKRIGIHQACYVTNTTNTSVRENATSGGVITTLLLYAFDKGLIDGVVLTGIDEADPVKAKPVIATSKEDVIRCQKTKYMLVPGGLLSVLREAAVEKGLERIAVVGSPCHIHAVRKIQMSANRYLKKDIGDKIKFAIGHNCAFNFFAEGTDTMLQALGVPRDAVKAVGWRDTSETPFPGQFCATTQDGDKRCMSLLEEYIILGAIYDHPRCRICYDWANEVSDISTGDEVDETGYHKAGAQRSHTVVRTDVGRKLFDAAVSDGYIEATQIEEDAVARNLGFVIKKVGNIPRIEEMRKLGLPLPEFGNYPFY